MPDPTKSNPNPNSTEIYMTKLFAVMDELDGMRMDPARFHSGMDPRVYGQNLTPEQCSNLETSVFKRLASIPELSHYSPELREWWDEIKAGQ